MDIVEFTDTFASSHNNTFDSGSSCRDDMRMQDTRLGDSNTYRQSVTSIELSNSASSIKSFFLSDDSSSDQNVEMRNSSNLFSFNQPSCSKSSPLAIKRPKLKRIGDKLKKLITKRDRGYSAQFRKLFSEEHLILSFDCIYYDSEKGRLIPGRLYTCPSHVAFHSTTSSVCFILSLSSNVDGVMRTNERFLEMVGEIQIILDNGIVCTFGSFNAPDEAYELLFRLWKSNEHDEASSELSGSQKLFTKMGETQTDVSQLSPADTASESTGNVKSFEPIDCECADHRGQQMIDSVYPLSANQMFKFLFTENALMNEFLVSNRRTDMDTKDWEMLEEMNNGRPKHKRTATYTVGFTNAWAKSSDVTEEQEFIVLGNPVDGFVIEKNAVNSGIPYADSFFIFCKYCITKISSSLCRLRVHAGVEFKKSVMFKGFIESMVVSGIQDYYKNLETYINSRILNIQRTIDDHRIRAGADDFYFNSPDRCSFRSLPDSNDGYDSDVDERTKAVKKRSIRSVSYGNTRMITSDAHNKVVSDSFHLASIKLSLQLITFMLFLLLLSQLWSCFFLTPRLADTELLSRLALHVQNANSLEELRTIFTDIHKELSF